MPLGYNRPSDVSSLATLPVPPAPNRPAYDPIKDNLRTIWNGVESLLKKAERSLAGTPFQSPFAVVNVLIELRNVCPFLLLYAT